MTPDEQTAWREKYQALDRVLHHGYVPFGCSDCPFAGTSNDFNPADPDEGHYPCKLLDQTVWGEDPACQMQDWQLAAQDNLRAAIAEACALEREKCLKACEPEMLFEDGVSADLHEAKIKRLSHAYMAGYVDGKQEVAAAISALGSGE